MKIRSLSELSALKNENSHRIHLRELGELHDEVVEVRVHMGDPKAKEILAHLTKSAKEEAYQNMRVIAVDTLECTLDVHEPSGRHSCYIKMDKKKTAEILEKHVLGGEPVEAYLMEGDMQ